MGVFGSLVILLYGALAGSNEELFWNLFACSAVMFLLPYAGMVLSFARMRMVDAERERPYRMPVNRATAIVLAGYCAICIGISAIFLMYTPGTGFNWPVTIGVVIVMLLGEITIRTSELRRKD